MNISLSAFAPKNFGSRDGFGSPVPRQPVHLHTQAESGCIVLSVALSVGGIEGTYEKTDETKQLFLGGTTNQGTNHIHTPLWARIETLQRYTMASGITAGLHSTFQPGHSPRPGGSRGSNRL